MISINKDRILVIVVFVFAAMLFTCLMLCSPEEKHLGSLDLGEYPMIGQVEAEVHMVIFEDIQCPGCKVFNETILPHLKSQYIDTGKMKLTIIPLSLFEGSDMASWAVMNVYKESPKDFIQYFEEIVKSMKTSSLTKELLLTKAETLEVLDSSYFEVDKYEMLAYLEKNQKDAAFAMGEIETPAIFIDGKMVGNISLSTLFYEIEGKLGVKRR